MMVPGDLAVEEVEGFKAG